MASLLIRGGRVVDPSQSLDRVDDLLIRDGRVVAIGSATVGQLAGGAVVADEVLDATGLIVTPGLVDMHVHLREPGREEDETIETGTAAAIAGGFTSVACIPNTEPPLDTQGGVEFIHQKAARADACNVFVVACASRERQGRELADIGQLVEAGAVAFSDDGSPVYDAELMRRVFEYCRMFDKPFLAHEEVLELTAGGVMHEGLVSMVLGLKGMPAAGEEVMIGRDIALAEVTGGRLHVMHLSTAGGVELVRRAKERGIAVTSEATPHHFTLTDECLRRFDSNYKMSPPLRTTADVEAILAGLADGTIDCIATDHAPHALEKKMLELDRAPFGILGLETAVGLSVTRLVVPGRLDWSRLVEAMSTLPAKILGINRGTLAVGAIADVTLIDPAMTWEVDASTFRSKSVNTPFHGWQLTGRAVATIVGGRIKYRLAEAAASA
ncbi:MAG: dihydroorotase [Pirellulales bacterium]|nr:dihydroorotase [Pirellulales bacterium]MBL7192556.1 dihydroorotase [Pirellulales bacterium]MDA0817187.1 dihydroorotase [Planctomycetota bacterium]